MSNYLYVAAFVGMSLLPLSTVVYADNEVVLDTPNGVFVGYSQEIDGVGELVVKVSAKECDQLYICHRANFYFGGKGEVDLYYRASHVNTELDRILLGVLVKDDIKLLQYKSVEYFDKDTLVNLMPDNSDWVAELEKHGDKIAIYGSFPSLSKDNGLLEITISSSTHSSVHLLPFLPPP